MRVDFVDTSILVEILDVPGRNANRAAVLEHLAERMTSGVHLILPTASVIETGNHVHHIKDGHARRQCAQGFADVLRLTAAGEAPWSLFEVTWNGAFLTELRVGATTSMDLVEHAANQSLSCGDLSVIAERDVYRTRVASAADVRIWTVDQAMGAWS